MFQSPSDREVHRQKGAKRKKAVTRRVSIPFRSGSPSTVDVRDRVVRFRDEGFNPLQIGKSIDSGTTPPRLRCGRGFNPLQIGKSIDRRRRRRRCAFRRKFQSPSDREVHRQRVNMRPTAPGNWRFNPLQIGKSIDRHLHGGLPGVSGDVSIPFRSGSPSTVDFARGQGDGRLLFQSPSDREVHRQRPDCLQLRERGDGFNPLQIGKSIDSQVSRRGCPNDSDVSIPFRSGSPSTAVLLVAEDDELAVSIPFRSGSPSTDTV